jgi:hypothetical protein
LDCWERWLAELQEREPELQEQEREPGLQERELEPGLQEQELEPGLQEQEPELSEQEPEPELSEREPELLARLELESHLDRPICWLPVDLLELYLEPELRLEMLPEVVPLLVRSPVILPQQF